MTFITCLTNQIFICRVTRSPSPPPHCKRVLARANLNPAVKPEGFVTVLFYLIIFRPHVMMAWPPTLFSSNLGGLEYIGSKGTKNSKVSLVIIIFLILQFLNKLIFEMGPYFWFCCHFVGCASLCYKSEVILYAIMLHVDRKGTAVYAKILS